MSANMKRRDVITLLGGVTAAWPLAAQAQQSATRRIAIFHPAIPTTLGRIAAIVGEAPKRVAINEWDSLEQAQAFYSSKTWKDLAPQRDKAQKLIRLFAVEAMPPR